MSLVRLSDVFFPPVSCVCVSVLVVGIWCAFTIFELAHWASHGNWFENISKWQMFRKIFWFWICNTNHILIRFQFLNFFNVFKQNEHFDDCNCPGVIHSKLACFFQMLRIELSQRFIFDCVLMVRMSKAFSMKSDWKYLEIGDSNFRICPHNWINVDRSMVRRARGNPTGSVHRSAVIIIIGYWRPQNRKPLNTITTIVGNVDRSSEHVSQTEVKKRQHMKRNAYWRVQRVSWKLIINIYCQSNIIVNLNRRPIFNATFRINVWRPMVRLLRFCFHFIGCRFSDEAAHQARIMQSQTYFCSFCLAQCFRSSKSVYIVNQRSKRLQWFRAMETVLFISIRLFDRSRIVTWIFVNFSYRWYGFRFDWCNHSRETLQWIKEWSFYNRHDDGARNGE